MAQPALPQDMIFEILSRTSLIGLGRCRLVSKEWNSMTYESDFVQHHCRRMKMISGFFRQTSYYKFGKFVSVSEFVSVNDLHGDCEISLKFLPAPVIIKAATKQGILLCENEHHTRIPGVPAYYVCKPSTGEWHKIPNPKTRYGTKAIAMVVLNSRPLRYKIVRFSQYKTGCTWYKSNLYNYLRCDVFDSETWVWTRLEDVFTPFCVSFGPEPPISVGGRLYWLMSNNHVFEFRADIGSWTTFDLPFPLCKKYYFDSVKLVDYETHLAMACMKGNDVQIWVMEDIDGHVWSKRETTSIESGYQLECMYGSDAALLADSLSDKYYCFKSSRYELFKRENISLYEVFPFQSDLEPINYENFGKKEQLLQVNYKNNQGQNSLPSSIWSLINTIVSRVASPSFFKGYTFVLLSRFLLR